MKYALQFALFRIQITRPGVKQYWYGRLHSEIQRSIQAAVVSFIARDGQREPWPVNRNCATTPDFSASGKKQESRFDMHS